MIEIGTGLTGGLGLLVLVVAGLAFLLYLVPIPLWIAAWASGAYVGLFTLIGMRLRRVPPFGHSGRDRRKNSAQSRSGS